MPRRKQWRRSERRKTEWIERSRVDDGDGTVMDRERRGTDCGDDVTLSPPNVVAGSPPRPRNFSEDLLVLWGEL